MFSPGKSHLGSIISVAESFGIEVPTVTVKEPNNPDGLYKVHISCKEKDRPFWLGFYGGMLFCRNNRGISVGCDSTCRKNELKI